MLSTADKDFGLIMLSTADKDVDEFCCGCIIKLSTCCKGMDELCYLLLM